MKLKFKNQDFQNDAVETVARLFKGQEKANTTFSVSDNSAQYNLLENEFGLGNRLLIDAKTLQENLNAVQKAHALPQTEIDSAQAFPISVEMETGTGKTLYIPNHIRVEQSLRIYKIYYCCAECGYS